ncbi:MAG: adenine phosphoribosyltransferase [Planctomycetes bacterium]|nr:adenine phosphoribosyltransferase [Planctomycetota bacterium]
MELESYIRDVPDFPKEGILFKDITPLLANHKALTEAIDRLHARFADHEIDCVVGIESRGFLFGVPLAMRLGCGFAPVRKPNKLPYKTHAEEYDLEYGKDTLEIHADAVNPGDRVLICDDLLATGGTMRASRNLIERIGGKVVACAVLIELGFLDGRKRLEGTQVEALITY